MDFQNVVKVIGLRMFPYFLVLFEVFLVIQFLAQALLCLGSVPRDARLLLQWAAKKSERLAETFWEVREV